MKMKLLMEWRLKKWLRFRRDLRESRIWSKENNETRAVKLGLVSPVRLLRRVERQNEALIGISIHAARDEQSKSRILDTSRPTECPISTCGAFI
jgi:hypothetical protein